MIVDGQCSLQQIDLLVNLLSQLQYLETRMNRTEMRQVIKLFVSKTNTKARNLFYTLKYINDHIHLCW